MYGSYKYPTDWADFYERVRQWGYSASVEMCTVDQWNKLSKKDRERLMNLGS